MTKMVFRILGDWLLSIEIMFAFVEKTIHICTTRLKPSKVQLIGSRQRAGRPPWAGVGRTAPISPSCVAP